MNNPYNSIFADEQTADKAASAVNDYIGEYTDNVTDLIKLLHLNRAIAKRVIEYAEPHMKPSEVDSFENTYADFVRQFEKAITATFYGAIIDINAYRLTKA